VTTKALNTFPGGNFNAANISRSHRAFDYSGAQINAAAMN
jgi:hypothetical protein